MEVMNYLGHTLLALYGLASMGWLIWCQIRRRSAFEVVVGESYMMLCLALVFTPVVCLVIHKVHRWQSGKK